jgi:hypothetical protein
MLKKKGVSMFDSKRVLASLLAIVAMAGFWGINLYHKFSHAQEIPLRDFFRNPEAHSTSKCAT